MRHSYPLWFLASAWLGYLGAVGVTLMISTHRNFLYTPLWLLGLSWVVLAVFAWLLIVKGSSYRTDNDFPDAARHWWLYPFCWFGWAIIAIAVTFALKYAIVASANYLGRVG